jgi:thiosulfate reductase cytochrome b subunit
MTEPIRKLVYRHRLVVRITHWIGAVAMVCLFMSGLQIFNAHPALYWGDKSSFDHPIMEMNAVEDDNGKVSGVTTIFGHDFTTTGVLGLSGADEERGFPSWITIPAGSPNLALGRRWHFFFAWVLVIDGLVYLVSSLITKHLQRDLIPTRSDLKNIGKDIVEHIHFRFPQSEDHKYNVLQKLAYGGVVLVAVPLIVLAGLTMSPRMDAGFPFLLDLFNGRQSARTVHFVIAFALLGFFLVHMVMVLVSGLVNNLRSMITGWSSIKVDAPHE